MGKLLGRIMCMALFILCALTLIRHDLHDEFAVCYRKGIRETMRQFEATIWLHMANEHRNAGDG